LGTLLLEVSLTISTQPDIQKVAKQGIFWPIYLTSYGYVL